MKKREELIKVIENFILTCRIFIHKFQFHEVSLFMTIICNFQNRKYIHYLLELYEYLKFQNIPNKLRFALCEILINLGKCNEATIILNTNASNSLKKLSIEAEIFWWNGNFAECIHASNALLEKRVGLDIRLHLLCTRGIAYFFLGEWEKAPQDLEIVINKKSTRIPNVYFYAIVYWQQFRGFVALIFQHV